MRTPALLAIVLLAASAATVPAAPPAPLRVLVTNDDGVGAPGIDALYSIWQPTPTWTSR